MLWHCARCTAAYSAGAPCCPQCGSTDRTEDEMPKVTSGGPSNASELRPDAGQEQEQEHPGYGGEMHGIEAPADGTGSAVSNPGESRPAAAQDEAPGALPPPPPPEQE